MGEHTIRILLDDAVPMIFSRNNRGFGPAAAIDAVSGELLDPQNPTAPGLLVSLFATGLGATEESKGFQVTTIKPTVYVAGIEARVQFSGKAPGFEGLNQVNIEIPEGIPGRWTRDSRFAKRRPYEQRSNSADPITRRSKLAARCSGGTTVQKQCPTRQPSSWNARKSDDCSG